MRSARTMRASARALPSALPLSRRLQTLFRIANHRASPADASAPAAHGARRHRRRARPGGCSDLEHRLSHLAAAEQARLAYMDQATHRIAFHHPLIRSAVVDLSHAEERRSAHRLLADVWADQPDRRAWHLAEATIEPNESVAAQLEAMATRILARGDAVGCVKALTRASELSPRSADRYRRLAAAAYVGADVAGDLGSASNVLGEASPGRRGARGIPSSGGCRIGLLTER